MSAEFAVLGADRRDGESPFGFGSDATVGLAVVVEIAGELLSGAVILFADGNLYSGAALLRQIVEVEYRDMGFCFALRPDGDLPRSL